MIDAGRKAISEITNAAEVKRLTEVLNRFSKDEIFNLVVKNGVNF